jgi:arylmalonate decarboxylase
MTKDPVIGLVVPFAADVVPAEGPLMYPQIGFRARGVGVRALTPAGYDAAVDNILPAAEHLASQGVDAIMVIGTSLTFYRGADFHATLIERLRAATGLPVGTMSQAVVEALRAVGARRLAVATAYADEVNARLRGFLEHQGFEVAALRAFGLERFGAAGDKTSQDIIDLAAAACAGARAPDGILISCGGLRTLPVAEPLERSCGLPVVSSMPAAFWSALRLIGIAGRVPGGGRLLDSAAIAPVQ